MSGHPAGLTRRDTFLWHCEEYSGIDLCHGDPQEIFDVAEMVGRGSYGAVWKVRVSRGPTDDALVSRVLGFVRVVLGSGSAFRDGVISCDE